MHRIKNRYSAFDEHGENIFQYTQKEEYSHDRQHKGIPWKSDGFLFYDLKNFHADTDQRKCKKMHYKLSHK